MKKYRGVLVTLGILLVSLPMMAGEGEEMTPEQMMEMMQKVGAPGDMHKHLDVFVGKWNAKATFWMEPDAPPMESAASSEAAWILGDRYVQQTYSGEFMGQNFTGIGNTGYDTFRKEYISTWKDSMSTQLSVARGGGDGKSFELKGTMDDPMSGQTLDIIQRTVVKDHDTHVFSMFVVMPDGSEFKNMEIVYTRAK